MKKDYFHFYLLFCFILPIKITLAASTFHAILVGDTQDRELREVIKKDLRHMEDYLNAVFDDLNIEVYEQTNYSGRDVNAHLMDDLAAWNIQSDDIVFFYFSGHGFYGENQEMGNWPTLYLSKEDIGINQLDIMRVLSIRNPRLLICFADCCNNILDEEEQIEILSVPQPTVQKVIRQKQSFAALNTQQLLEKTRGVIMISSASPSYYAEGTDERGSCFTNRFIKIFQKNVRSNHSNINWNSILSQTQQALWKRQRPQYQLLLD